MTGHDLPLDEMFAQARRIHPQVECAEPHFAAFVASRLARGTAAPDIHARAAELYLVCACLHDAPGAAARLDELFLDEMRRGISRIDPDPAFVTALQTRVRDLLFVGDGHPRIDDFSGQVPLAAWVRVFAIRTALETAPGSSIGGQAVVDHDRVLRQLQREHGAELAPLVRDALAELDMRMRTTLRMHLNDHLAVEDIARLFRVHHTTVHGWLAQALRQIRAYVTARLPESDASTQLAPRTSRSQILRLALSSTIVAR